MPGVDPGDKITKSLDYANVIRWFNEALSHALSKTERLHPVYRVMAKTLLIPVVLAGYAVLLGIAFAPAFAATWFFLDMLVRATAK